MTNEVYKLLQEFSIRMNDRPERPEEEEDEFDFDLSGENRDEYDTPDDESEFGGLDFDKDDLEFGDFDKGEPEDEFGNFGSSGMAGLDDVDDGDGEFAGERKVDITDRLKDLLAKRGDADREFDSKMDAPDLNLSDINDLSDRSPRRMRGHDDMETPDRLGRFRNDRMGRRDRGTPPSPEFSNRRER